MTAARASRRAAVLSALAATALVAVACSSGSTGAPADVSLVPPAEPAAAAVTASSLCTDAVASTAGSAPAGLTEASGLAAGRARPGALWSHDDSGGDPEVFALLAADGGDLGRVTITGAPALDWEDIALLPGASGAPDRLVIGDIGNNPGSGERDEVPVRVIVVDEPAPPGGGRTAASAPATVVAVAYADGPRDAETVLADPRTGEVFVVSKQWDGAPAGVYRVPLTASSGGPPVTIERVGSVEGGASLVTGGDISPDGSMIALRTYTEVLLWDRAEGRSVAEALAVPPTCRVVVVEPQGEAVAFLADGRGFVTLSEGEEAPLRVRRLP